MRLLTGTKSLRRMAQRRPRTSQKKYGQACKASSLMFTTTGRMSMSQYSYKRCWINALTTITSEHDPSKIFQRMVNKRVLPGYYDVISEPIALSTIKQKLNSKEYLTVKDFVRDFALVRGLCDGLIVLSS